MKKLIQNIFLITLVTFSGCTFANLGLITKKPLIDENLPSIDPLKIKMIASLKSIAIEWENITDPQANGYYLYRSKVSQAQYHFKRIAIIKNKYISHYLDTKLKMNTQYVYGISIIGANNTESKPSNSQPIHTLKRLGPVSFITAISNLPRQIKILWRPHTNKSVSKYLIQRGNSQHAQYKTIAKISPRLQVEYIDKDLPDSTEYSYRIKAVTFDKIVSEPSIQVKAITRALPTDKITMTASQDLPRKIQLRWQPLKEPHEIIAYNIYKEKKANGKYTKIAKAKIQDNAYDDIIKEDGKVYFYKITTVDKTGLESDIAQSLPITGQTLNKPLPPIITLAQIQGDKVILNWITNEKKDVTYNIYKTIKEGFFSSKIEVITNVNSNRYEDAHVIRGATYSYSIEAVDEHGIKSLKTRNATLTMPRQKIIKIAK